MGGTRGFSGGSGKGGHGGALAWAPGLAKSATRGASEAPSLGDLEPIFQSLRNTARRIFGQGGRRSETLLMLLCLADLQGADDAVNVFFWYLKGQEAANT